MHAMHATGLRSARLDAVIEQLDPVLRPRGLADIFANALRCALETTCALEGDDATVVITGDIGAMWLRDSTGQMLPYLRFCDSDVLLRRVVRGLVLRQARCLLRDPYANAFTREPRGRGGHPHDETEHHRGVWERKWEVDSPCWELRLLRLYVSATDDLAIYAEPDVRAALGTIIHTFEVERDHATRSKYAFRRLHADAPQHDTSSSAPVAPTGMLWGAFRPSDDGCVYNYHIPSQMLAVVELNALARAFTKIYRAPRWAKRARALAEGIEAGIERHGVVEHPAAGRIYAYEVDGLGHTLLLDDANPYYFVGELAAGIGSPHTPAPHVWPLALITQALTATQRPEIGQLLQVLRATDGGTGYLHESFHPDDPTRYTRGWFAWANALFAELVLRAYYDAPHSLDSSTH
jgi:hypothetical protein